MLLSEGGQADYSRHNLDWINYHLGIDHLKFLQNSCGVHLCPSESEGFGHTLMEALSTGAVLVTTDAPPMNEFADDFLVPYGATSRKYFATMYYVDLDALEDTIEHILEMPIEELEAIGRKNRELYLEKTVFLRKIWQD